MITITLKIHAKKDSEGLVETDIPFIHQTIMILTPLTDYIVIKDQKEPN